ncbi:MAG: dimethyl sulfoxide reductase anchor subunit family protein [bacterium]|jgi:DMSO reductase anchor subunit|nr:dimethyl sulfoxide reductase anchor subunit [Betaproteobacteria bacterium]
MHPAFSVIFLTTLIGVAQGLFLAVFAIDLVSYIGLSELPMPSFIVAGCAMSVLFAALGLLASFWHLGRPERAWRAATMWRTSWLSREVIVLPAFLASVAAYGFTYATGSVWSIPLGVLALIACIALFVCTGMIYACLRFLQEWASPLTLVNYFLLGCASGFTFATLLASLLAPAYTEVLATWSIGLTTVALAVRAAMLARNARLRPKSTVQSAIGVKHPKVQQKSQGAMGGSFNTREFSHGRTRGFLRSVKWAFLLLAFPLPALLLWLGASSGAAAVLALAFAVQYVGLLAERWFFFAQANHPQNLYYQAIS